MGIRPSPHPPNTFLGHFSKMRVVLQKGKKKVTSLLDFLIITLYFHNSFYFPYLRREFSSFQCSGLRSLPLAPSGSGTRGPAPTAPLLSLGVSGLGLTSSLYLSLSFSGPSFLLGLIPVCGQQGRGPCILVAQEPFPDRVFSPLVFWR